MLVLTRKPGESLTIQPHRDVAPATPVAAVFAEGPIEVVVLKVERSQVKIGIEAHPDLTVLRSELDPRDLD